MFEFQHDYVKPKNGTKEKLYSMNTDSIIVYIQTGGIYRYIAEDVKTRFDTCNYELDRPLSKGKCQKLIGLMKDKLSRKILMKFFRLRSKTYSYLIDDDS